MKKKLLSLLTSLMLACSLAAFMPQQNSVNALESTQTEAVQQEHQVQGEVVGDYGDYKLVKLDDSIEKTGSDMSPDAGINATPSSSFVAQTGSKYGYNELGKYSNGSKRQAFYNAVYNTCLGIWNQTIDSTTEAYKNYYIIRKVNFTNYGLSRNEAIQTYTVVRHDNPSFYFTSATIVAYTTNTIVILMPKEYNGKATRTGIQKSIITYADNLRAKIKDNYTNYYKALTLNNALVNDLTYAYDSNGDPVKEEWAHNVYGAASYRKCVCEGYAKMFQMVMNMSQVENVYVIGTAQGGGHAWNLVKLDNGSFYWYDTTWNDSSRSTSYNARGNTYFSKQHTPFNTTSSNLYFLYNLPSVPAADYNGTKNMYKNDVSFTKQLTGARQTAYSYGSATISWNVPAVASGVYVYQKKGSNYVQIAKLGKGVASYTAQNLTEDSIYYFQLKTYYVQNGKEYVSDKPSTVLVWTEGLPSGAAEIVRFAGNNRYSTAVEISKQIQTNSNNAVMIASGTSYADALAGVTLSHLIHAPILLSAKDSLDPGTLAEIKNRKADKAIILGGTGVISKNVESQLIAQGLEVIRISGKDRFETSVKIAQYTDGLVKPTTAFFVYYNDFADALSVSSVAARLRAPVLFIRGNGELDPYTKKYLESRTNKINSYVIGGPKLISNNAENNISSCTDSQTARIYGQNRYETSLYFYNFFTSAGKPACLATGTNYPDALAGAAYASQNGSVVLLVPPSLTEDQVEVIKENKPKKIVVFGGTGAVTTQAAYQAAAAAAA